MTDRIVGMIYDVVPDRHGKLRTFCFAQLWSDDEQDEGTNETFLVHKSRFKAWEKGEIVPHEGMLVRFRVIKAGTKKPGWRDYAAEVEVVN